VIQKGVPTVYNSKLYTEEKEEIRRFVAIDKTFFSWWKPSIRSCGKRKSLAFLEIDRKGRRKWTFD
jgi:hypothetical protein